jgi:GTP-binding protein LepA
MTRGYASMDYEYLDFRAGELVKLDILINGDVGLDSPSGIIVDRTYVRPRGSEALPQRRPGRSSRVRCSRSSSRAAIGAEGDRARDVKAPPQERDAKCYGGDITRKRKLLERQKRGRSA